MTHGRYGRLAALFFCLLLPATAEAEAADGWLTDLDEAMKVAAAEKRPVLVDMWASWCQPCLKLGKETFTAAEVTPLFDGFVRVKLDMDAEKNRPLEEKYSASQLPQVFFLKPNGERLEDLNLARFEKPADFAQRLVRARQALGLPAIGSAPPTRSPSETTDAKPKAPRKSAHPVKASLVLGPAGEDGSPAHLGLHLKVEDGWHVYWRYPSPSELGKPIRVDWSLPEGHSAGEFVWPVPLRFEDFGFVTYGYEKEVLVSAPLTVPADTTPGTEIAVTADVEFLVCDAGNCILENTTLMATLPWRQGGEDPTAPWRSLAAESTTDWKGFALNAEIGSGLKPGARGRAKLEWTAPPGTKVTPHKNDAYHPSFLPFAHREVRVDNISVTQKDSTTTVQFDMTASDRAPAEGTSPIGGLLRLNVDGAPRIVALEATLSHEGGTRIGGHTDASEFSLWQMLLFALLGGLILNIMPCVLPVLSIKAMGLLEQADDDPETIWRHGVAYGAGVMVSFWILAAVVILLQSGGELIGWGFQFQSPEFVIGLAVIVYAFALSLFGVYEIGMPGMQSAQGNQSGMSGSFMNGAFATLLATPCTAPLLAPAMAFAFTQPAIIIVVMFSAVGLGLALPFLLLARFPALIQRLPKPGPWMETFKQIMGFLLVATALWLLDVLAHMLSARSVTWILAFMGVLTVALWSMGRFADFTATRVRQWSVTIGAVAVVALSGVGLFGNLKVEGTSELHTGWQPFSDAFVQDQVKQGKTVFIDFTAEWCITCKANENGVLYTDEVESVMDELGVVRVKADNTTRNPEIDAWLRRFGRNAVPLYVILPANRAEDAIRLPEILTTPGGKDLVIEKLREAGPSQN
jgi:thiol:disulfide interchange protein DsbD